MNKFRNLLKTGKKSGNTTTHVLPATVDLQCGTTVWHVPAELRTQLWLSIVNRRTGHGLNAKDTYYEWLLKDVDKEVLDSINKDINRTFPDLPQLNTPGRLNQFRNVLKAYAAYDTEVGYCQGMNFLAGLLLAYIDYEDEAFGLLVVLMKDRKLRELYKPDMTMLQARLWHIGKLMPPVLAVHMESHATLPVLYASSWLMTCFASDFPVTFAARVMDTLLAETYVEPMMKVVLTILKYSEHALLNMEDMEDMIDYLKQRLPNAPHEDLHRLLTDAFASNWTLHERFLMADIDNAETVVAAVNRVESNNLEGSTDDEGAPRGAPLGAPWLSGSYGGSDQLSLKALKRTEETVEILEDFQRRMLANVQRKPGTSVTVMRAKPQWRDAPVASTSGGHEAPMSMLAPPPVSKARPGSGGATRDPSVRPSNGSGTSHQSWRDSLSRGSPGPQGGPQEGPGGPFVRAVQSENVEAVAGLRGKQGFAESKSARSFSMDDALVQPSAHSGASAASAPVNLMDFDAELPTSPGTARSDTQNGTNSTDVGMAGGNLWETNSPWETAVGAHEAALEAAFAKETALEAAAKGPLAEPYTRPEIQVVQATGSLPHRTSSKDSVLSWDDFQGAGSGESLPSRSSAQRSVHAASPLGLTSSGALEGDDSRNVDGNLSGNVGDENGGVRGQNGAPKGAAVDLVAGCGTTAGSMPGAGKAKHQKHKSVDLLDLSQW